MLRISSVVIQTALLCLLLCGPVAAKDLSPYVASGTCDGFPKVHLTTAPGLCVGIVARGLGFPRGVVAVGENIYVIDMGDWKPGVGRLLEIGNEGRGEPKVLLQHLYEPNSIATGPHGTLYLSVLGKILQFHPATGKTKDIVINLPAAGRHNLSAFTVAPDGSLYIDVGSATDHCETPDGNAPRPDVPCPETVSSKLPRGSIIHIIPEDKPIDAQTVVPVAVGLRNSEALAVLPSGQLYAAVNARDAINQADPSLPDDALPHDTFDKIQSGQDYGWPYCYDDNRPSPEYPSHDCSKARHPTLLLPAHAAPLGMIFYQGTALPELNGKLIIGYHGFKATGHRIVSLALDKAGNPNGEPVNIVSGWDAQPGDHPQGAPVDLTPMEDGSILVTEDKNGTLLRISRAVTSK